MLLKVNTNMWWYWLKEGETAGWWSQSSSSMHSGGQWDIPQPSTPACKWGGLCPHTLHPSVTHPKSRQNTQYTPLFSLFSHFLPQSLHLFFLFHGPGCCSDTEADSVFKMTENKDNLSYRRSAVVAPKTTTQFNQFLPTKDKASGYVPAPLRKKRAERNEDNRRSWASSSFAEDESSLTR